jgi:hypothetical protein
MTASPPAEAFPAAQTLLQDTILLAEARTGADLSAFRRAVRALLQRGRLRSATRTVSQLGTADCGLHRYIPN